MTTTPLLALIAEEAAKAGSDAMTGGGIVGGIVTVAGFLYVLWEKVSKRRTEARREKITDEKEEIKLEEERLRVEQLAQDAVQKAYETAIEQRKRAHEADIAGLSARIKLIEGREDQCQKDLAALRAERDTLAKQITALQSQVAELERRLREAGSLPPGTDVHEPLKG